MKMTIEFDKDALDLNIDLHGMNLDQAIRILEAAKQQITGKLILEQVASNE